MLKPKNSIKKYLKIIALLAVFILVILHQNSNAQQMFVDDAAVTTTNSFQIETWYGSRESWFLPAVSPVLGLEIGTGIGFDSREGLEPTNWIFEMKFVPGDLEKNGWALGVAAGLLYDFDGNFEEFFLMVPFSRMIFGDTSQLHFNLGLDAIYENNNEMETDPDWSYDVIKGIRGDFGLTDRFTILSEIAAANFDNIFFQGGLRISVLPGLLEMDITYGEGFRRMETAPGFNIGLTFTPDSLW